MEQEGAATVSCSMKTGCTPSVTNHLELKPGAAKNQIAASRSDEQQ